MPLHRQLCLIFAAGCFRDPWLVHPRGNYDSSVGPRTRARHGARIHKRTGRCGGSDVARSLVTISPQHPWFTIGPDALSSAG